MRITLSPWLWRYSLFWMPNQHKNKLLGERLRLALQELGPVWVRFGQMFSTRHDLFPPHVANRLALLQDRVAPFDGLRAKKQIEKAMGGLPVEEQFDDFEVTLLASASVAQVHIARLKSNGKEVVVKIIHPGILPVIGADLELIYRLARWVPRLPPNGRRLRPTEIVREYEKTLIDELNLLHESANAVQLRYNFEGSPILYIPEMYSDYCSQNIMMMRRIYGIPVSDVAALEKDGTSMKLLAERDVQVFFTQIFRDSFFHADMHPRNILVSYERPENPKYIGINCGIVGSLDKEDKRYLAGNFIVFFSRDCRKIAELHVDSDRVLPNTNIEKFKSAVRIMCRPIFEKPLAEISLGHVLLDLFSTAHRFNMEVQLQLVLLQKTLSYIKGVGRQLYPQLDLWKTTKPSLESWIKDQIGIPALARAFKEKAPFWVEKMPEVPELVYDSLRQGKYLQHSVDKIARELHANRIHQG